MKRHLIVVIALLLAACSPADESAEIELITTTTTAPPTTTTTATASTVTAAKQPASFSVSSPVFGDGELIPEIYTCDGSDLSPELVIEGLPLGTRSLVLIVDDPDAPIGTWDHWVEFDIPAGPGSYVVERDSGPVGVQAVNSWNLPGYGGPCPPQGEEHRYVFTVYAVDGLLDLPAGVDSQVVYETMEGRVIDSVQLIGLYGR